MTTQLEKNVVLCESLGLRRLEGRARYIVFDANPLYDESFHPIRYYLGKAGAFRVGRSVSHSSPASKPLLTKLLEIAARRDLAKIGV